MTQPQALHPLVLPLYGERLIEASAGTGKTFTLAGLYLRLLLGLGKENAYLRPLSVEEILVVTFTEAATEELRGRIRENIHGLRLACVRGETNHPLFTALLAEIEDKPLAATVLLAAERQIDEAAIYTIHGFCQRMLNNHAFESGMLFQQTLLQDESLLQRQACADFWRRYCYPLPFAVARAVSQVCSGPEALLRDIYPYLQGEIPQFIPAIDHNETLTLRHDKIIARIDEMKAQWRLVSDDVATLIEASGVDKRSYSKSNLPKWLNAVQVWAEQETQDYAIPDALHRFGQQLLQEKTKKGDVPSHAIFAFIDDFCRERLSLHDVLLFHAVREVRHYIQQEKRIHAQLGFDDMLTGLAQALNPPNGERLAAAIRQHYPVALIDEFQDTDPQQYHIFHTVYGNRSDTGLLLIGDPKQAIYAFRGADIFTYMRARSEIAYHYTLTTNWRSSPGMVAAVNQLFNAHSSPFLFSQIPFWPIDAAQKNQPLNFVISEQVQPEMAIWLAQGEGYSNSTYQRQMATCYAAQIRDWLTAGKRGEAVLYDDTGSARPVVAQDITILVRNRSEAALMRDALSTLHIPSVYLSNRDSVFASAEARDVLWLLQAILVPEQERTLRSALAVGLLGLSAAELDSIMQDETRWDALVDEFVQYRRQWLRYGVLPMLRELLAKRRIAENLLAMHGGERRLTDVLHLGELLQQAAQTLESEPALVRWLAQQIAHPAAHVESQQLRLESDRHLVQIVTIHKSKGLEFPIVCLPFIGAVRKPSFGVYHDRQNFQAIWDLSLNADAQAWAEEERLAEDLRLLYVALTRSIYHCSFGLAPLFVGQRKQQGVTDVHRSAIGYLVQQGHAGDAVFLRESLLALCGQHIALYKVQQTENAIWQEDETEALPLGARQFSRNMQDHWRVTSYSGLQQGSHGVNTAFLDLLPQLDIDASDNTRQPVLLEQHSPHTFPKGAMAGTFLHSLLETLDFTQPMSSVWLQAQLRQQGLDDVWLPVLQDWLADILHTPLSEHGPCLAQISPACCLVEMQFYLPIEQLLQSGELDALVKGYDPLSALCPKLDFQQVQGMLKGFIDLVFCWQGRYYILDYKSNWLGEDEGAYTPESMVTAMVEHRYDLQYQLYSLALHRYLRHRVPHYSYQTHFGGVYYCFLRGMVPEKAGQGVFACRPDEAMIDAMDQLLLPVGSAEQHGEVG